MKETVGPGQYLRNAGLLSDAGLYIKNTEGRLYLSEERQVDQLQLATFDILIAAGGGKEVDTVKAAAYRM